MGKVLSIVSRPLRNYNIGNRAQKYISKEKPNPAPRHPTTVKLMEETKYSPSDKDFAKIPEEHLNRLKEVYVKSKDAEAKVHGALSTGRQLPQRRDSVQSPEFGFEESKIIPEGKISMRQAIDLIAKHQSEPDKWTSDLIAKEFRLSLPAAQKILAYFRSFDVWSQPKVKKDPKIKSKRYLPSQNTND